MPHKENLVKNTRVLSKREPKTRFDDIMRKEKDPISLINVTKMLVKNMIFVTSPSETINLPHKCLSQLHTAL